MPTDKLSVAKLPNATGTAASDDLKLVAGSCECLAKSAKLKRQGAKSSTTPSTASSSALLGKRDEFKVAVRS